MCMPTARRGGGTARASAAKVVAGAKPDAPPPREAASGEAAPGAGRRRPADSGGPRFPLLAERLRQVRAEAGHNQRVCARLCGVGQQTWASWESGARAPKTARQMQAICDLLHVDPGWLMGLTSIRRPWPAQSGDECHAPSDAERAGGADGAAEAGRAVPAGAAASRASPTAPGTERHRVPRQAARAEAPAAAPLASGDDARDPAWLLRLAEPDRFGGPGNGRAPSAP